MEGNTADSGTRLQRRVGFGPEVEITTSPRVTLEEGSSVRITAIEPSGNLYGSEQALFDVIRGTSGGGFEWDVVVPGNGEFETLLTAAGIPVRAFLPRDSHLTSRWNKIGGYLQLALHLAKQRPAVVYLNQAGMLRSVSMIANRLAIPIVCQVQTLEDAHFIASTESLRNAATSYICNSKFIAAAAEISPDRLSTFYQPILTPAGHTSPNPPNPAEWRVGILGRIATSKGHYVLLDAARMIVDQGRGDIRFVVIGEGLSEEDGQKFESAVSDKGLVSAFEFRGFRRDVAFELSQLHALVIPSLAEPLGRVVLDACIARRPIILSDSGGLGEFSRALDIGIRVPAGDSSALASSIVVLLDNYDAEYERFSKAAARTERTLTPDSYLDAIESVLSNAANRQPSSLEWFGAPS
jgi:glycosyltransferase involved in cell wall biosynthesis